MGKKISNSSLKRRNFPEGLLPSAYDSAALFCYFNDLYDSNVNVPPNIHPRWKGTGDDGLGWGGSQGLTKHKEDLANDFVSNVVNPIKAQLRYTGAGEKETEQIENAIKFITKVAESERKKELHVIEQYLDQLQDNKLLQGILNAKNKNSPTKSIQEIIQELKQFSKDLSENQNQITNNQLDDFYAKLIILINTVRKSLSEFKTRLQQIVDNATNKENLRKLAEKMSRWRDNGDLNRLMQAMLGLGERDKKDSFASQLSIFIVQQLKKLLARNVHFKSDPLSVIFVIFNDFKDYLYKKYATAADLLQVIDSFDTWGKTKIKQVWDEYIHDVNQMYKRIVDQHAEAKQQIATILSHINGFIGLKEIKQGTQEWERREKILNRSIKNLDINQGALDINLLTEAYNMNPLYVTWSFDRNSISMSGGEREINKDRLNIIASLMYEYSQEFSGSTIRVGGHPATDTITIGSATFSIQYDPEFYDIITRLAEQYRAGDRQRKKAQDTDTIQQAVNDMNASIKQIIKDTQALIDEKMPGQDIFIYNESLKLYQTVEEGRNNAIYHGRDMILLNMLDLLYDNLSTIEGFSNPLVDRDLLYNICMNLANNALGHDEKDIVSSYLSIFAGLLMFDDIQQMTLDMIQNTSDQVNSNSNVYMINLYLLNDIYVPGSMLLSYFAQVFRESYYKVINTNLTKAKVNITTSEADRSIREQTEYIAKGKHKLGDMRYNIELWDDTREEVFSGTRGSIKFLGTFVQFLTHIRSYFY